MSLPEASGGRCTVQLPATHQSQPPGSEETKSSGKTPVLQFQPVRDLSFWDKVSTLSWPVGGHRGWIHSKRGNC